MPSENTRERLLIATCEMLREDNLSKLSVERIAKRAGLSRRIVFWHFKSKDLLLSAALSYLRKNFDDAMREWSAELSAAMTVEERIQEIFVRILKIIREPEWRGSAFIRLSGELAELRGHPIHQIITEAKDDQKRWFERELNGGTYRFPALLAEQLTIIMTGLFQMQLIERSMAPGEAVLQLIPLLLAASRDRQADENELSSLSDR